MTKQAERAGLRALGRSSIDVEYDPIPNARTCRLVRDLYAQVFALLTDRKLQPRDAIDVQPFLWVASGMARELNESRARKALEK